MTKLLYHIMETDLFHEHYSNGENVDDDNDVMKGHKISRYQEGDHLLGE